MAGPKSGRGRVGAVPVRGPRGLVVGKTEEADTTGELGTPGGRLDSVWASPPPGPHRARAGLGPEEPEHRPSGAGKSRGQGLQLPGAPAPNRGGGGKPARRPRPAPTSPAAFLPAGFFFSGRLPGALAPPTFAPCRSVGGAGRRASASPGACARALTGGNSPQRGSGHAGRAERKAHAP